jgi:hypothetical protein
MGSAQILLKPPFLVIGQWTMPLKESLTFIYIHVSPLDPLADTACIIMYCMYYHLNRILSSGANVIIWSKCYHVELMSSFETQCYHLKLLLSSGASVVIWS